MIRTSQILRKVLFAGTTNIRNVKAEETRAGRGAGRGEHGKIKELTDISVGVKCVIRGRTSIS